MRQSTKRDLVQVAILPALFAGALVANSPVVANTVVCVPQDMTLASAFDQAQTKAMTIQIVLGSYNLAGTVWHAGVANGAHIHGGTQVLGGYGAGCASRNIEVGNTVFFDSLFVSNAGDGADPRGDLTVEGITFADQNGIIFNAIAGVSGGVVVPGGTTILLRRNAFVNSVGNFAQVFWGQADDVGGTIRFVDNLIAGNQSIYCSMAVDVVAGSPEIQVVNNSVVDNTGAGSTGSCFYNHHDGNGNGAFRLYNNIFYGNSASYDVLADDTSVALVDNVIGTRSGPSPNTQVGTLNGDPKLDASYHPIEAPASPVINSGNDNPPGGLPSSDLDGGPRVVGSRVDRGAFESAIENGAVQLVKNNNDSGTESLRAAVDSVNFNGGGTIKFAFNGGSCPHVITLDSELVVTAAATINGYSDPDAAVNDLDPGDDASICIILEAGSGGAPPTRGLVVPSNQTDAVSVTIKGLAFSGFSTAAIDLQGGSQHTVVGNHFGGSVGGHALQANGFDVRLGASAHDSAIGSGDPADRNIIGDATNSGIVVSSGSTGNQIIGNYVGIGWSTGSANYTNRGNGARGIYVAGDNSAISGNLIGHNAQAGIVLDSLGAHDNLISANQIGTDYADVDLGNAGAGIRLIGDSMGSGDAPASNTIRFNAIAHNGAQGVLIDVGQGNRVRKNSIYGNALLGIDLDAVGITANDDDGGIHLADLANRGQNFPLLASAQGGYQSGTLSGSLTTTPGDYTVDFYNGPDCDSSGNGEGKFWLGGVSITVPVPMFGDQGTVNFNPKIDAPLFVQFLDGSKITATATDVNGNTSEFSACVNYLNDTLFTDGFEGPPPTI